MVRSIVCGIIVIAGCGPATRPDPADSTALQPVATQPAPQPKKECKIPRGLAAAMTTTARSRAAATLETLAKRCPKRVARLSGELAKLWHSRAIKNLAPGAQTGVRYPRKKLVRKGTLRPADLEPIARVYKLQLELTGPGKVHAQAAYYRAELLWTMAEGETARGRQTGRWERAATAFGRAADDPHLSSTLLETTAYAEVLAYKNALSSDVRVRPRKPITGRVPEREQLMINAFERYARIVDNPYDPEVVVMQFLAARIYWRHELWDQAVPRLETIVRDHLTSNVGEYAVNILLDTLNRTSRIAAMARLVVRLRKQTAWLASRPNLKRRLDLLYRQLRRRQVVP